MSRYARILIAVASLLLASGFVLPLWRVGLIAPQYPEGLGMLIKVNTVVGMKEQDLHSINGLNHYIGMRPLETDAFTEFAWMPFALGGVGLLLLRAATFATLKEVVDAFAVFVYVGAFSLWSFAQRLYSYGHELSSDAPVKVAPFMPPLFGHQRIANFDVYSYPRPGGYVMAAVALALLVIVFQTWRQPRPAR